MSQAMEHSRHPLLRSPRRTSLRVRVAIAAAVVAFGLATEGLSPAPATADPASEWLAAVNGARAQAGLRPLAPLGTLNTQASLHNAFMARTGQFCHSTACDQAAGPNPVFAAHPNATEWGENLAWISSCDIPGAHRALMESPTHRANILNPRFTHFGIAWGSGVSPDGRFSQVCYATQQFAAVEGGASQAVPAAASARPVTCRGRGRRRRCRAAKAGRRSARRARRGRRARR